MTTPYDRKILGVYWKGESVHENTIDELLSTLPVNMKGICVKTFDGNCWQGQYDHSGKSDLILNGPADLERWVTKCQARGIEVHAWGVVRGTDVDGEVAVIADACAVAGVKSMLLDIEVGPEYFRGGPQAARAMAEALRRRVPSPFHIGVILDYRGAHPRDIALDAWLPFIDSLHPMTYHVTFGLEVKKCVSGAFESLRRFNLPVVPMLQGYGMADCTEITTAAHYAFSAYNAPGISFWRLGKIGKAEREAIGAIKVPDAKTLEGRDVEGRVSEAAFTNQDLINAITKAAATKHEDPWGWMIAAGLTYLVENRHADYRGTPLSDLPGLTQDEKYLIRQALAGKDLTRLAETEPIVGNYTNQQVINAFYEAVRMAGNPDPDAPWQVIASAGLEPIAHDRSAPFGGPPINNLPKLNEELKSLISSVLLSWPPLARQGTGIEMEWVTQIDRNSEDGNDCGQACVLMLLKYYGKANGLTVEDLSRNPVMNNRDKETFASDLKKLAELYHLALDADCHFGKDDLIKWVLNKRPVILLVNYWRLQPRSRYPANGHWIVVSGYEDGYFTIQDPLYLPSDRNRKGGANVRVAENTLEDSLCGRNAVH